MKTSLMATLACALFSGIAAAAPASEVLPPVSDALAPHAIVAPLDSPRTQLALPPIASTTAPHAVATEQGYSYASTDGNPNDAADQLVLFDRDGRIVGTR